MSKTEKNLREAFAGESQANRRYLAFARRAADEYKEGIYKLFVAVAEAETIHAHNLAHLKGVKSSMVHPSRHFDRMVMLSRGMATGRKSTQTVIVHRGKTLDRITG